MFSVLLLAIYAVATISSSLSILLCEHPHHHHAETHHDNYNCEEISFEGECCQHHHSLLGENHTDYIANEQRYDSRSAQHVAMLLMPQLSSVANGQLNHIDIIVEEFIFGDEPEPLRAALTSHKSLRAPPVAA